jgi:Polyketide cyclase / dehydrase and lipid transport
VRIARAEAEVALAPEAALRLWTDLSRWASFIEGFARVVEVDPDWPAAGRVIWDSIPAGRGRVTEKVAEPPAAGAFATLVFEDRLAGRQTFKATESADGARVELSLEYTLTRYGPLGALADAIFIRRALRDSLRRTMARFEVEAEEEAGLR